MSSAAVFRTWQRGDAEPGEKPVRQRLSQTQSRFSLSPEQRFDGSPQTGQERNGADGDDS
jgi:hypothetical protein